MTEESVEVRLGNDIARQFTSLPTTAAAEAIADHLRRFWAPPMRSKLSALARTEAAGLHPLLRAAIDIVEHPP
jgi:formate dehydrogenase subunit delta